MSYLTCNNYNSSSLTNQDLCDGEFCGYSADANEYSCHSACCVDTFCTDNQSCGSNKVIYITLIIVAILIMIAVIVACFFYKKR